MSAEDIQKCKDLKVQGNELFAKSQWAKALTAYDQAMRLCKDPKELAVLHNNKAACHLKAGRWKDAVKECTNALRADDTLMKARLRRAKAFERGNMVREAFEDYHVINATDLKTHETQQAEARLGGILNAAANRAANGAPAARQQPPPAIQFKFCLDDDIRVVRFGGGSVPSYAYLLDIAHSKYSEVTEPFKLSYKDGEGQLITIRESEDVNVAMTPVVTMLRAAAAQGDHGPKLPAHLVVKFFLTKVPESEVPAPPEAEVEELRRFKEQQATFYKLLQERIAEQERLEAAGQAQGEQSAAMGLDEWILQFAQLFRDATNIDFDRHIDLNSLGQEKLSAAMNASLNSEQAEPLFQEAILKFKEQISMGIYNWGQALATIARKHLDDVVKANPAGGLKEFQAHPGWKKALDFFAQAEAKFNECFKETPNFYDALIGLGTLELERAKIMAGQVVASPFGDLTEAEAQEAAKKSQTEVLARLKKEDVAAVRPAFAKALEYFDRAIASQPATALQQLRDRAPLTPEEVQALSSQPPTPVDLVQQAIVLKGNVKFDLSQLLEAVGDASWTAEVEGAATLFAEAKCPSGDIRTALAAHSKGDALAAVIDKFDPK